MSQIMREMRIICTRSLSRRIMKPGVQVSRARTTQFCWLQTREPRQAKGRAVSRQTVVIGVWLGIPGLALIWANLGIWRRRHFLIRLRQDVDVIEVSLQTSVVPEKPRTACSGTTGAPVPVAAGSHLSR